MAIRTNNADVLRLARLRQERERIDSTCRFWAMCAVADGDGSEADDNYNAAHAAGVELDRQIEELDYSINGDTTDIFNSVY